MSEYFRIKKFRLQRKQDLVDCLGGKCAKCGYDKCIEALDFHHINTEHKDFTISSKMIRSLKSTLDEIQKCVLLCNRCHRELHSGLWLLNSIEIPVYKDIISDRIVQRKKQCYYCNKEFYYRNKSNKYCSNQCRYNSSRKVVRPSKDRLEKLISIYNWVQLGRMFGVTDNAVKKWAKKYGINIQKHKYDTGSDSQV